MTMYDPGGLAGAQMVVKFRGHLGDDLQGFQVIHGGGEREQMEWREISSRTALAHPSDVAGGATLWRCMWRKIFNHVL